MIRDVFDPVPESERPSLLAAYANYLAERDGEADFERRTLLRIAVDSGRQSQRATRRWIAVLPEALKLLSQ